MTHTRLCSAAALWLLAACSGQVDREGPRPDGAGGGSVPRGGGGSAMNPGGPMATPGTGGTPGTNTSPPPPGAAPPKTGPQGEPPVLGNEGDANTLDPAALFACKDASPSYGAPRIWRLNHTQYTRTLTAAAGSSKTVNSPFAGATSDQRFENYAAVFGMDGVTASMLVDNSDAVARALTERVMKAASCLSAPSLHPACARAQIGKIAQLAFRRPLTAEEQAFYAGIVIENSVALGRSGAVQLAFETVLNSPNMVFRSELGTEPPDRFGRRRLGAHEIASAIAYTITNGPPDQALLDAAAQNALATPEQVRGHVSRLLAAELQKSDANETSFIRFAREYFQYDKVLNVFKDPVEFGFHKPPLLMDDTDTMVSALLRERKGFLEKAFTTTEVHVINKYGFTQKNYNVTQNGVLNLPSQRSGILTQPAWLAGFSEADHNDPIRRGKFVRESLLCLTVPKLTIGDLPPLSEDANATLREKLKQHAADPKCAGCHELMDPIGLGFEAYDHVGRWRTTETGKPVDARGVLSGAGAQDGPFNGVRELAQKLVASPVVSQCFLRHVLRFYLGRNETPADACTLVAMQNAYKNSGGDLVETVTALLTSDSFLFRKADLAGGAP